MVEQAPTVAAATSVAVSSSSRQSAVDMAVLGQRLRQLEYRLLARDANTGLAPLADEAPEPSRVVVSSTGLLAQTGQGASSSEEQRPTNDSEESSSGNNDSENANATETANIGSDTSTKDLLARLASVRKQIKDQLEHRQAVVDLWRRYDACRALLAEPIPKHAPPASSSVAAGDDGETGQEDRAEDKMQFESAALSMDARVQLLMETSEDWMRTVALLEEASTKQASINPGEFQQVSALMPRLTSVSEANTALIAQSKRLDKRLERLLAEYNDTIHTLSELFLHWNQMLDDLEARVRMAERRS